MFSINNRLIKQVVGCSMGGVVFSDIYVCKTDEDIVIPENPIFYKSMWMTIIYEKKNETDKLFLGLNS